MPRQDPLANPGPLIRRVYAYAAYRVGDGPDAEDVTSEVFERAVRDRANYDPAKGEPIAWLFGIARHVIADNAASRVVPSAEIPEAASPVDLEEETVLALMVAAAVATLDERDRELVALRYGADLTARQIGEVLGLRTNAVEVALHRVLARLRARMGIEARGKPPEPVADGVRV